MCWIHQETLSGREKVLKKQLQKNTNLVKNIDFKIQEAQQTPSRINTKKSTAQTITIKLLKTKDKEFLKVSRERRFITNRTTI